MAAAAQAPKSSRAVTSRVVKVNVDTDNQFAFTRALTGHVLDHWGVLKVDGGWGTSTASTRARGGAGEAAMAERVRQSCEQLGSAGGDRAASASASDRASTPLMTSTESVGLGAPSPGFAADPTVPVPPYG